MVLQTSYHGRDISVIKRASKVKYSITVKIKSTCDNYLVLCQSNWASAPRCSIEHYSEKMFLDEVYI